jgi:hypothetical protein
MMPHTPPLTPEQVAEQRRQVEKYQSEQNLFMLAFGVAVCLVGGLVIWFITIAGWKAVAVIGLVAVGAMLATKKCRNLLPKLIEKLIPWAIGAAVVLFLGNHFGWNRHYGVPIPYLSGPSKADIQSALSLDWVGEDWKNVDVIDRWPQVKSGGPDDKKCNCRRGTTLYPISIRGRFMGPSSAIETLSFYFFKDDFGKWQSCFKGD